MLTLNPEPTFTVPVELPIPGTDGVTISVTFKYRGKKELLKAQEEYKEAEDAEWLLQILAGWDGVDAEFTPENVSEFAEKYPAAALKIATEYPSHLLVGRRKN